MRDMATRGRMAEEAMREIQSRPTAKPSQPRLTIELVPATTWGQNLRSLLAPRYWTALRKNVYRRAASRCEICSRGGRLDCHEIWEYDDAHSVQRLVGCKALCGLCHRAKHIGRTMSTERHDVVKATYIHIAGVNGWSVFEAFAYAQRALLTFERRSLREWMIDISWVADNEHLLKYDKSNHER